MARIIIAGMKQIEKDRNSVHEIVPASYSVFDTGDNQFIQIDTYGRASRDMPEKISQSIQLDKENALRLAKLILQTFVNE